MSPPLPIAVDAMGGDHAPAAIVEGAVQAARAGMRVLLVGDVDRLSALLPRGVEIELRHAPDALPMEAPPTAVRSLQSSSLWQAVAAVGSGDAGATVSCGNSGAMLVAGVLQLGTLEGVERPGIATLLPRADGGKLVLLDSGANVDCRPEQLVAFARMGAAYAQASGGGERVRVGLLSNGHEEGKGNALVRQSLPLLEALPLDVVGNVEPTAALAGACEVLVCDGFVGNVLLKGVEAAAETVIHLLKAEIARRLTARMGAAMLSRTLGPVSRELGWSAYGGGLLLGLHGLVVVGHGRANAEAVRAAIELAHRAQQDDVLDRVRALMTGAVARS